MVLGYFWRLIFPGASSFQHLHEKTEEKKESIVKDLVATFRLQKMNHYLLSDCFFWINSLNRLSSRPVFSYPHGIGCNTTVIVRGIYDN